MSRRVRSSEEAFSLFPFLAVLLCTMGTLAMIFVLVAQNSSNETPIEKEEDAPNAPQFDPQFGKVDGVPSGAIIDAESLRSVLNDDLTPSTPATEEEDAYARALTRVGALSLDEITSEQESLEWFLEELRNVRERTSQSLEEDRARLANVEAALARLRSESEVARRKYEALTASNESDKIEGNDELQKQISELDVEIERLQEEALSLREKNANLKRSYAIVPYQGKKGTFRRPIFVECNERGVFIQPEEIRFDDRDFLLARYPGNPFDSALRAVSQHYLATGGQKTVDGDVIEPYPLIVVRPGGAEYFYPAIAALASWGDVYGYEFVEDDQNIVYPDPDPTLKELATRQADFARARLSAQLTQILAAAQVRNAYGAGGRSSSSSQGSELSSRLGSNVRLDAARATLVSNEEESALDRGTGADDSSARTANSFENDHARSPLGTRASASIASSSPTNVSTTNVSPTNVSPPLGTFASAAYSGSFSQYVVDQPTDASVSDGDDKSNVKNGFNVVDDKSPNVQNPTYASGNLKNDELSESGKPRYVPNVGASEETPAYLSAFMETTPTTTDSAANVAARETLGNTSYAAGASGDSTEGELAQSQGSTRIAPVEKKPTSDMPKEAISLSKERKGATGNERGILTLCANSSYVFPKQPGLRYEITVSRDGSKSPDERRAELLDAVALCIKSWGLAGRDSYWAPFVKAEVESGGEDAFRELSEFCRSQGLKIVRIEKK